MSRLSEFKPKPVPAPFDEFYTLAMRFGPKIVKEAFKCYGLKETPGAGNTPEILEMAAVLGGVIEDFYTKDSIPWCGLAMSYWMKKSGYEPPKNYSQVRARDFAGWGVAVDRPSFGDILVFWRGNINGRDGHVGIYIAEDKKSYYVLGANQSDMVNITAISKDRLLTARRCEWRLGQPGSVRPMIVKANLKQSTNEA